MLYMHYCRRMRPFTLSDSAILFTNGRLKRYKGNFICMTLVCFGYLCNALFVRVKFTSCVECMMHAFFSTISMTEYTIWEAKVMSFHLASTTVHSYSSIILYRETERKKSNNKHRSKRSEMAAFFSWTHSKFSCRLSILWCKMMVWLLYIRTEQNDVCNIKTITTNHTGFSSVFYSYTYSGFIICNSYFFSLTWCSCTVQVAPMWIACVGGKKISSRKFFE